MSEDRFRALADILARHAYPDLNSLANQRLRFNEHLQATIEPIIKEAWAKGLRGNNQGLWHSSPNGGSKSTRRTTCFLELEPQREIKTIYTKKCQPKHGNHGLSRQEEAALHAPTHQSEKQKEAARAIRKHVALPSSSRPTSRMAQRLGTVQRPGTGNLAAKELNSSANCRPHLRRQSVHAESSGRAPANPHKFHLRTTSGILVVDDTPEDSMLFKMYFSPAEELLSPVEQCLKEAIEDAEEHSFEDYEMLLTRLASETKHNWTAIAAVPQPETTSNWPGGPQLLQTGLR